MLAWDGNPSKSPTSNRQSSWDVLLTLTAYCSNEYISETPGRAAVEKRISRDWREPEASPRTDDFAAHNPAGIAGSWDARNGRSRGATVRVIAMVLRWAVRVGT